MIGRLRIDFIFATMEIVKQIKNKIAKGELTKMELHKKTGLSRVTINTRLEKGNWKKIELLALSKLV